MFRFIAKIIFLNMYVPRYANVSCSDIFIRYTTVPKHIDFFYKGKARGFGLYRLIYFANFPNSSSSCSTRTLFKLLNGIFFKKVYIRKLLKKSY
jgi:hypothetical protein